MSIAGKLSFGSVWYAPKPATSNSTMTVITDPRHAQDAFEEVHHDCALAAVLSAAPATLVAFTFCPGWTYSWPTVMMSTSAAAR
jgi:hypothetical protein